MFTGISGSPGRPGVFGFNGDRGEPGLTGDKGLPGIGFNITGKLLISYSICFCIWNKALSWGSYVSINYRADEITIDICEKIIKLQKNSWIKMFSLIYFVRNDSTKFNGFLSIKHRIYVYFIFDKSVLHNNFFFNLQLYRGFRTFSPNNVKLFYS